MKLTTKGRYAVMAMADLAFNANTKAVSLTEISLRQNISLAYLEQIFIKLKNKKLVKSSRGATGGYILEKPASEIKLSHIIFAVNEEVKMLNCKKNSKKGCNNKSTKCITHNLWDELDQHINGFFEKVKLQDLVKQNFNL
jgi:Rrf2 family iron-sulfur cluster assembly transcriptional regulator